MRVSNARSRDDSLSAIRFSFLWLAAMGRLLKINEVEFLQTKESEKRTYSKVY